MLLVIVLGLCIWQGVAAARWRRSVAASLDVVVDRLAALDDRSSGRSVSVALTGGDQ